MLGEQDPIRFTRLEGGYSLQAIAGGHCRLTHECGKTIDIDDPDDDPVRWHVGMHRCGPISQDWHSGLVPPSEAARLRSYGPGEMASLMQYIALVVDAADPEMFKGDNAFAAGQRAAWSLETALTAAEHWRLEA